MKEMENCLDRTAAGNVFAQTDYIILTATE